MGLFIGTKDELEKARMAEVNVRGKKFKMRQQDADAYNKASQRSVSGLSQPVVSGIQKAGAAAGAAFLTGGAAIPAMFGGGGSGKAEAAPSPETTTAIPQRRPGVTKSVVASPKRTTTKTTVAGPKRSVSLGMSQPASKPARAAPRNWRGDDSAPAVGQKALFSGKKRSGGAHDTSRLKWFRGRGD